MTTYAGAIPVTSVNCPPWCTVTQQEHLDDLDNWEGRCIHWGRREGSGWFVDHGLTTFVDGSQDGDEPSVHTDVSAESLTLDEAELYARAILVAVEEARS